MVLARFCNPYGGQVTPFWTHKAHLGPLGARLVATKESTFHLLNPLGLTWEQQKDASSTFWPLKGELGANKVLILQLRGPFGTDL